MDKNLQAATQNYSENRIVKLLIITSSEITLAS